MSNSEEYALYQPNNETYLTADSRDVVEQALAYAVANGSVVDVTQHRNIEVSPRVGVKLESDGIFFGVDLTVRHTTTKTYTMKR